MSDARAMEIADQLVRRIAYLTIGVADPLWMPKGKWLEVRAAIKERLVQCDSHYEQSR